MQLKGLFVAHLSKDQAKDLDPSLKKNENAFYMETCQRWIWIFSASCPPESIFGLEGIEIFRGREAYTFLLKLATGLESKVLGETDIFGQLKTAWYQSVRSREASKNRRNLELGPWMQRIFEDTKEIRTRYLQNLGGASYGSLVRKFIKERIGCSDEPIFLIGAGQLAQSVAPYLLDSGLWIWNRDRARLLQFHQQLLDRYPVAREIMPPTWVEEEIQGWEKAAHIVICVPMDEKRDPLRREWFQRFKSAKIRSIVHLGALEEQCKEWKSLDQFYCLSDLFVFQKSIGNIRSVQIAQAHRACDERAKLRDLGASLSICHGWEDLASFA